MTAIYPKVNGEPIKLRKCDDGTGNALSIPYTFLIPASGYSESIGLGGLVLDLVITNAEESSAAASDDEILIETLPDKTFAGTPVVTEEYGTVPYPSIPAGGNVVVRNIEAGDNSIRINNTSSVDIYVDAYYTPNRV